jgi:hypothetical protein
MIFYLHAIILTLNNCVIIYINMNAEARDLSINFVCQKNVRQFDYCNENECQERFEEFRTENKFPITSPNNYLVMLLHVGTNSRITEIHVDLKFTINDTQNIEFRKHFTDVPAKPIILGEITMDMNI